MVSMGCLRRKATWADAQITCEQDEMRGGRNVLMGIMDVMNMTLVN